MDTKAIAGICGAVIGIAFLLVGALRTSMPRRRRLIFAYTAVCFFVYGALEYFGIIHLESLR